MTDGAIAGDTGSLAGGDGSITDFTAAAAGATSGIGILKRTGTAVLKAEIQALEQSAIIHRS